MQKYINAFYAIRQLLGMTFVAKDGSSTIDRRTFKKFEPCIATEAEERLG